MNGRNNRLRVVLELSPNDDVDSIWLIAGMVQRELAQGRPVGVDNWNRIVISGRSMISAKNQRHAG